MKFLYEKRASDFDCGSDRGLRNQLKCRAHLHYHVEIVYMIEGRATAFVDAVPFEINTGDLLVVFPNKIHRFEDEPQKNRYDLFIINPNLAPDLAQRIATENPRDPVIRNANDNSRVMALISILRDVKSFSDEHKQVLLRGYLTAFFAEILEMLPMKGANPEENQAIRSIVKYCSRNFTKELSLSVLEEELHLSKYYISHLFGEKLGISFNDYVNFLRVSEACRLLRMSDMSITEISGASGFGTLRTFNRSFIKQMNTSPSDYRKNNRGEIPDVSIPRTVAQVIEEKHANSSVPPLLSFEEIYAAEASAKGLR